MSYEKIKKCVRNIQEILIDDVYMSMESAKAINKQLELILALAKKDDNNGSNS
jgi:negative regulator of replication initiation